MSSTRKHKADDGDEGEEGSPSSSPRSSPHRVKKSPTSSSGNKKRRLGTNGSDDSTAATSSSSSSTSTSSSSVFSHPALHQLPPHLLNHSHGHPGGDLGESLRFSQVARLLDASAEDGGLGLGHSSSGLGTSTDSSFWKMLETEDPSEVTKQMNQTAELQQQLLKTAHLLRSSQDGTEAAAGNHNHQDASLYASQGGGGGHQPQPSLSQSQLMSALMGSASANELLGEGVVDYPPLSASTHALLTSFIKQEGASSSGATIASVAGSGVAALPLPPPPHGTLAPSPASAFSSPTAAASSSGKKSGGGHKATRSGSTSPAPQSSSSTSSGGGQAAAQHSAAAAAAVAGMNDGSAAAALLSQLASMEESVDNQLKAMKFQQCDVIDTQLHNRAEMDKLLKAQGDLRKQIEQSVQRLEQLNDTHILTATDAYRLVCLSDSFALHARRLRLYQEELFQAQSGQPVKPVASLVITKQPFPCTVKQSKSVDDPVDVVLITGAKSEIQAMGQVKAELINEDYNPISKKKNSAPAIQNAAETMDESLMVTFKRLIFPHGSRVKSVNMRFAQEVTMNGSSMRLLSEPTKPFIVMTNHGQRSTTEGKLLKKHTFANRSEIPWPAFANAMQIHYIRATKQDPKKPVRPLSNKDIEYLHLTKFNGKMSINQEDYDQFWAWFGTILYKIRNHQKHILPMWIKGLIYGFLSREDSDRLLLTQGALPGSFLIRFSDRCAGQFVVVYVTSSPNKKGDGGGDDREVKHYLINPEDIEKKSTLPDFLRDCENLWFLLQVVRDHDTGVVSLRPKNKDELLASFYSREKSQTLLLGYDNRQP